MTLLYFNVGGEPIPQGSKRLVGGIKTHARLIDDNPRLKAYRKAVTAKAKAAMSGSDALAYLPPNDHQPTDFPLRGPVDVVVTFYFSHLKAHYKTVTRKGKSYLTHLRDDAPAVKATRPDVDKLCRSILDALTDAGVYADDGQVVMLFARKLYWDNQEPKGTTEIIVRTHE